MGAQEDRTSPFHREPATHIKIKSDSIGRKVRGISFDSAGNPHDVSGTIYSVNDGYVILDRGARVEFEDLTF